MVNPWLALAGFGMIAVGIGSIVFWNKHKKVKPLFYGIGFLAWFIAIFIKVVMDLTFTSSLFAVMPERYRVSVACIYYGLRTGFLESGFLYLIASKMKIKNASFSEAVGIGIAFGAMEAVLTGVSNVADVIMFFLQPELLEKIPEAQRAIVEASLNLDTIVIFAPIIERTMTLIIHVTAAVLVVLAFKRGVKYLITSIAYKSLVDGIIPLLKPLLANPTVANYYLVEIPFIVIALASMPVLRFLSKKFGKFNKSLIGGSQRDLRV